jgi:exopolysaccharide/PEP-CTERM locus tyrosine autokinase
MGKMSKVLEKSGVDDISGKKERGLERDKIVENENSLQDIVFNGSAGWDERLTHVTSFSSEASEAFRVLRSAILMGRDGNEVPRTIMVTSALPREGKSFVSANLGIALAHGLDQHALLVDCDLRVPSLAQLFGVPSEKGLSDYLQEKETIEGLIRKTSVNKLSIVPSGQPPVNPSELLGSSRMHDLVKELSERYEDRVVIFDSPPFQVASESRVLAQAVDGVVMVVRYALSDRSHVKRVIDDIGREKILGTIFNGMRTSRVVSKILKKEYSYGQYYKQK